MCVYIYIYADIVRTEHVVLDLVCMPACGKGANASKNRPHDACPVRCRVPGSYEPCSERVCVCQLKKRHQLKKDMVRPEHVVLDLLVRGGAHQHS